MDPKNIAGQLEALLPDRPRDSFPGPDRQSAAARKAGELVRRKTASDLAALKARERAGLRNMERRRAKAEAEGLPFDPEKSIRAVRAEARHKEKIEAAAALEAAALSAAPSPPSVEEAVAAALTPAPAPSSPAPVPAPAAVAKAASAALRLQGTSRPEMDALLSKIGLDLSLRLTKNDTANLLACLLTCNETQLKALKEDARVPVVIKTVINRLLEDVETGSMATVMTLWHRVFGDKPLEDAPQQGPADVFAGVIPGQPVSREAYVVIRDTLMR